MIPTINVNLKPCACNAGLAAITTCVGAPVLIPCPIPRSVVFNAALGECDCGAIESNKRSARETSLFGMACLPGCPALCVLFYRGDPTDEALSRYVDHLIAQVGSLP